MKHEYISGDKPSYPPLEGVNVAAQIQQVGIGQRAMRNPLLEDFQQGIPARPQYADEAKVTKAFHDAEMAKMRERCSRLAQMLADALKS